MSTYLVAGKDRQEVNSDYIRELADKFETCVLDIGAGDGKGSLRYARKNEQKLVIALDSSFDALVETSKSGLKKPSRGGASNLVCLYGNIKDSFHDLQAISDITRVYLPWGDLLEGIALLSEDILSPIAKCTKPGGQIELAINAEIWKENLPKHFSHLGEIAPNFFTSNTEIFENFGIKIQEAKALSKQEIADLDTTWSAKLMSSRSSAQFIMAKGVRI